MANIEELIAWLERGKEDRSLEFKESCIWKDIKFKIIKTALAMANLRDGGRIIIGVKQEGSHFKHIGMNESHIQTYKEDDIQALINNYADPYVRIQLQPFKMDNRKFLAIIIKEYDEIPVICKKDGRKLRAGAIYVRFNRMPETCEIPSQTEMREILKNAIDLGVRNFLKRMNRIGIPLGKVIEKSEDDKFNDQIDWM